MKKVIILLFVIIMFQTPLEIQAQDTVVASTFDLTIPPLSWRWLYYDSISSGRGIYGDFTVESGKDVNFFVCDESAYLEIVATGSTDNAEYSWGEVSGHRIFTFITPYSDSWYFCWSNYDSLTSVTIDGAMSMDVNGPTITTLTPSSNQVQGTVQFSASAVDDHFSVRWMKIYIDDVQKRFVYDDFISYSWDSTTVSDGSYEVTYEASDTVGNVRTIHRTVYVDNTQDTLPPPTTGGQTTMVAGSFLLPFLFLILLAGAVFLFGRRSGPQPDPHTIDIAPPPPPKPEPIREVISKVLVICPYCGAKNEQGILKCQNCKADL